MAYIVKIPKLGLTMTEGTINSWFKSEGDEVKKGDVILELSTDKLVNEIEADEDGILRKILLEDGETRPILYPIGVIAKADEDITDLLETANSESNHEDDNKAEKDDEVKIKEVIGLEESQKDVSLDGEILASPYAKHIARERDLDLSLANGTGMRGMIISKDLDNIKSIKASPLAEKMMSEYGISTNDINLGKKIMKDDVLAYLNSSKCQTISHLEPIVEKATPMRKAIAKNMSYSFNYSPRVTFNIDVDATEMKVLRNKLKHVFKLKDIKLTYNHILMKVCAQALKEYPYMNAQFDGEKITIFPYVNLGLAVGLDNGLIVPNIKDVDNKNLTQIAIETQEMIDRAKYSKATEEDLSNSTFTITNLGNYGITSFTPIINQPEVAILGVNQLIDKPVVVDGQIVIRPMLSLSLTADHRLIDGVYAAEFLNRVKELLENPLLLLA